MLPQHTSNGGTGGGASMLGVHGWTMSLTPYVHFFGRVTLMERLYRRRSTNQSSSRVNVSPYPYFPHLAGVDRLIGSTRRRLDASYPSQWMDILHS